MSDDKISTAARYAICGLPAKLQMGCFIDETSRDIMIPPDGLMILLTPDGREVTVRAWRPEVRR